MNQTDWYLIAYDITDPRRLQRLHRALRKEAMAVQRSVFLVAGSVSRVEGLLDRLETLLDPEEDDLRAYPVPPPEHLWLSGQCLLQGGLLHDTVETSLQCGTPAASDWRRRLASPEATPSQTASPP
jgi:CRISPR-associated protein Cas2